MLNFALQKQIKIETQARRESPEIAFSRPPEGKPSTLRCPVCEGWLLTDDGRHFWCPVKGHLDLWEPRNFVAANSESNQ